MIILHTLKGQEFAINGGLIERVEQDNETHVTLATGTSYLVREPLDEVVDLHREDRARVRVLAAHFVTYREDEEIGGDDAVDPQSLSTIVQFRRIEHGRASQ
jgi:uncharacterized protein YlzI (FlbEa/FlbD family)